MRNVLTLLIICFFSFKSYALNDDNKSASGAAHENTGITYGDMIVAATYFADVTIYVCEGKSRPLTASGGSGSYQWYYNDVLIPNATSNQLIVDKPGRYYVISNKVQSNTVVIIMAQIPAKPKLTFTE